MSNQTNGLEVVPPMQMAEYQEQSASMVQQREKAKIESRYIMALRAPRDLDVVRQKMLRECSRPSFCAPDMGKNGSSVAIYRVPRGGNNIEGVTIRFAEMAKRCYGHIFVEVTPLGEDENQQIYQIESTDYQNNDGGSEIVMVPKRIERSYAKASDTVLSQRTNSKGQPVYTIVPTDDDLQVKRNALNSKARRNVIMQCIDGWLVQECIDKIRETAANRDAEDPGAAKTRVFDAFASIGVTAPMLNEYLGHANPLSPAELEDLRGYYGGIKEGYTTWGEIVASKESATEDKSGAEQLEKLFNELAMTPAVIRRTKAKYLGRDKELVEWLTGEIAKKANDGGKKEAPANPTQEPTASESTKPASSDSAPTTYTSTASSTPTATTQSHGQSSSATQPMKQQEAPKQSLDPAEEEGW